MCVYIQRLLLMQLPGYSQGVKWSVKTMDHISTRRVFFLTYCNSAYLKPKHVEQ